MTPKRQLLGLAGWLALVFTAAAIGAIASVHARDFYAALAQPTWAPPAYVFGPVWSLLYLLMGLSAWLVWREPTARTRRGALALFIAQLAANALWSWLFFAWHQGRWAFLEIVVLWCLIVATLVAFWRIRPLAGALLLPYIAWVSFAMALAYHVWRLNPAVLGS